MASELPHESNSFSPAGAHHVTETDPHATENAFGENPHLTRMDQFLHSNHGLSAGWQPTRDLLYQSAIRQRQQTLLELRRMAFMRKLADLRNMYDSMEPFLTPTFRHYFEDALSRTPFEVDGDTSPRIRYEHSQLQSFWAGVPVPFTQNPGTLHVFPPAANAFWPPNLPPFPSSQGIPSLPQHLMYDTPQPTLVMSSGAGAGKEYHPVQDPPFQYEGDRFDIDHPSSTHQFVPPDKIFSGGTERPSNHPPRFSPQPFAPFTPSSTAQVSDHLDRGSPISRTQSGERRGYLKQLPHNTLHTLIQYSSVRTHNIPAQLECRYKGNGDWGYRLQNKTRARVCAHWFPGLEALELSDEKLKTIFSHVEVCIYLDRDVRYEERACQALDQTIPFWAVSKLSMVLLIDRNWQKRFTLLVQQKYGFSNLQQMHLFVQVRKRASRSKELTEEEKAYLRDFAESPNGLSLFSCRCEVVVSRRNEDEGNDDDLNVLKQAEGLRQDVTAALDQMSDG